MSQNPESHIQAILDSTAEGIWGIGMDGNINFVNKEALRIFGYENASQVVGQNSHLLFHHSHENGLPYIREECPIFKALPIGQEVHLLDDIFWKANGTYFHGEYRSKPLYRDGKLEGAVVTFLDVTDRYQSDRALRDVLESMTDGYFSIDRNWVITSVNKQLEVETGVPREQQLGKSVIDLYLLKPGVEKTQYFEKYNEAMKNRTAVQFEEFYEPLKIWTSVKVYPKADGGISVFFSNITERKNIELKLASERKKIEEIINMSPAAMALWKGPDLVFELVNPGYQAIFPGRKLLGLPFTTALPEFLDQPFVSILKEVLETGVPYVGKEVLAKIKPSEDSELEDRYYDFTYVRIHEQGKPYGVFDHAIDVTDRVEARKKNAHSEDQFAVLANTISQLTWMARADGFIYWYNQNWYDYTGTDLKQTEGFGWQNVHHPEYIEKVIESWSRSIKEGNPWMMEFPLRSRDGSYRWFLTRAAPVRDANGEITGWIGSNTDIQGQIESIKRLEAERDIRDLFVATLTHDLRTPLTSAKMTAQLLAKKNPENQDIKRLSDRISSSMDRADSMIKNLLDANRLKAGEGVPLSLAECNLLYYVEKAVENLQVIYGPRFEIRNEASRLDGYWDGNSVQRIIENLCANAIKYGSQEGSISITLRSDEKTVELQVHNFGDAIPENEQANLFDTYRRVESENTNRQKGWGIGLALVKGITEGHGGQVSLESFANIGTTFIVKLPFDPRPNHAE